MVCLNIVTIKFISYGLKGYTEGQMPVLGTLPHPQGNLSMQQMGKLSATCGLKPLAA